MVDKLGLDYKRRLIDLDRRKRITKRWNKKHRFSSSASEIFSWDEIFAFRRIYKRK